MISITLLGERETRGFYSTLPGKLKLASTEIELDIARDVQKGTRQRIASRFRQRSGRMWESVRVHKFGRHWGVAAGGVTAPYFPVQEYGKDIVGWHFVPGGLGKHGEGTSRPGGMIRIRGRKPFSDAIASARARSKAIGERRLRRVGVRR